VRCSFAVAFSAAALSLCLAACASHNASSSEASPAPGAATEMSAEPAAPAESPAAVATASAQPSDAGSAASAVSPTASSIAAAPEGVQTGTTPIPAPTPTPDPNILSSANGTILRSYSPPELDGMNDGNLRNAAGGIGSELPAAAKPPYVFTFEFPGVATISEFEASLGNPETNGPAPSVAFAVSTTSATSGFTDVGSISGTAKTLTANTKARWVRVTANQLYESIGATGTIAPPPAPIKPDGIYVEQDDPDKNGTFVQTGARDGYDRARFVAVGPALVVSQCRSDALRATYVGRLEGRHWSATLAGNKDANPTTFSGDFNDEGTVVAGLIGTSPGHYFTRTTEVPAWCIPRVSGTGAHRVLVLDSNPVRDMYPIDAQPPLPGYRFEAIGAGMLDDSMLAGKEAVWVRDVCNIPELLAPEQRDLLLKWVAGGHKLIVSGGTCYNGSDFTWLTYPFTSAGPGPESTNASLIQIENSALGTNDKNDAGHFVDAKALVSVQNSLAATAVVTTNDPHWCGHFFVAKTTNLNGFAQMYAVAGNGLIIYDGFNSDDDNPVMQRIRQLELAVPVGADLPCTQHVTDSFILEPNQEATFSAGKAQTVTAPLEILANQGWNGHVTIKTTGDLPATVSPNGFDLAGGTKDLALAVHVPATAKAGVYTVNAAADNGSGKTARASFTLTGTAPLVKEFKPATQKRIRIYGIHFDVDSAVIQPRSEPVIAEIAQILKINPGLRFQVEGHTDSDGGAAYNLGLSQRRAQAVVDDLVKRYGIARSRLVAKGFGLTKPVAPNTTDAGKALNRRVELLRL